MKAVIITKSLSLKPLLFITLLNYISQIPYFLYNYLPPRSFLSSIRAFGLLGLTLVWFLVGLFLYSKSRRYGKVILLGYLIFEALFYLALIISGALLRQLQNPVILLKVIFIIGYLNGALAGYYAVRILRKGESLA